MLRSHTSSTHRILLALALRWLFQADFLTSPHHPSSPVSRRIGDVEGDVVRPSSVVATCPYPRGHRLGIPPSPSTRSFFATSTASIDADNDGLSSLHDDAQNGSNDICAAPMIGMCPTIAFGGDGAEDMRLLMRYFETSVSSSSRRLTWSGGLPLRREMESTGDH